MLASLGVTNLANKVVPPCIVNNKRSWNLMVKIEHEEHDVDLVEYANGLYSGEKSNGPSLVK